MSDQTTNQLCGVIHASTGARCEKPVEHLENHIGQFLRTIQWPKDDDDVRSSPTNIRQNNIDKLKGVAWDAGVEQALIAIRDERDGANARLAVVEADARDWIDAWKEDQTTIKDLKTQLATLTARCEALEKELAEWKILGRDQETRADVAEQRCEALEAVTAEAGVRYEKLESRYEALTAERDKAEERVLDGERWITDLRAELASLRADQERMREALQDLCDAIPDETLAADPPLAVWRDAALAALSTPRQP